MNLFEFLQPLKIAVSVLRVCIILNDFTYPRFAPNLKVKMGESSAGSVCCFLEQETFTPQKVLVIPRNRSLRLNMTEKLFTGTLNHNQNKTKTKNGGNLGSESK